MERRTIVAGAAAALLVAGTGGAAIGANLTLLGTERDDAGVGRLEVETARAELATAALADDGAAPASDAPDASTAPASDVPDAPTAPATATAAEGLTAAEAIAVARAAVGGTLLEVEWSVERGRTVFEVTLRTEDGRRVEVEVDAADGTVLEIEEQGGLAALAERAREEAGSALDVVRPDTTGTSGITAERAIAIATAEVGGRVLEVEREREDGVDVFGVELGQDDGRILDVMIDAVSGAVLRIEEEWRDDDDDDRDDRDDAAAWSGVTGAIAPDAAVAAARAAVGGGDLVEVEREGRRGAPVYEV